MTSFQDFTLPLRPLPSRWQVGHPSVGLPLLRGTCSQMVFCSLRRASCGAGGPAQSQRALPCRGRPPPGPGMCEVRRGRRWLRAATRARAQRSKRACFFAAADWPRQACATQGARRVRAPSRHGVRGRARRRPTVNCAACAWLGAPRRAHSKGRCRSWPCRGPRRRCVASAGMYVHRARVRVWAVCFGVLETGHPARVGVGQAARWRPPLAAWRLRPGCPQPRRSPGAVI